MRDSTEGGVGIGNEGTAAPEVEEVVEEKGKDVQGKRRMVYVNQVSDVLSKGRYGLGKWSRAQQVARAC